MDFFNIDRRIIDLNSKDMFSIETFTTLQQISGNKIDEKNKMVYDYPLIELDQCSRNMSMYEGEGVWNAISGSEYIQEKLRRGTCFGELDHPDANCDRERFMKVYKPNVSHRNVNIKRQGNHVFGDVQFVAPQGYIPWDWITKGINVGMSIRILTPNYQEKTDPNGNQYIYKHGAMRFVSFDCVDIGGFKEASIAPVDNYDASKRETAAGASSESYKIAHSKNPLKSNETYSGIHLNWTHGRKQEEFKRLLNSQESLPLIEDIYGFSMKDVKNISYSKEGLITLVLEQTQDYTKALKIPTSVYKVNQILCAK